MYYLNNSLVMHFTWVKIFLLVHGLHEFLFFLLVNQGVYWWLHMFTCATCVYFRCTWAYLWLLMSKKLVCEEEPWVRDSSSKTFTWADAARTTTTTSTWEPTFACDSTRGFSQLCQRWHPWCGGLKLVMLSMMCFTGCFLMVNMVSHCFFSTFPCRMTVLMQSLKMSSWRRTWID